MSYSVFHLSALKITRVIDIGEYVENAKDLKSLGNNYKPLSSKSSFALCKIC